MNKLLWIMILLILIGGIQLGLQKEKIPEMSVMLSKGYLAYNEFGSGDKVLIMIHGSPGAKDDFKLLAPELTEYKIYALDMYGFGDSTKYVDNYGIREQAQVVAEFMNAKQIDKATLLGYSWGGGVVTEFAYQFPERTTKVILLSGMGIQEGELTGSYMGEHLRYQISYPFITWYPGALVTLPAAFMYESGVFIHNEEVRRGFMRSFMDSDQRVIRKEMTEISIPTLILHGTEDMNVPSWVANEHHRLLKNSKLVWFTGGHGTIFSNVTELAPAVQEFIDE